MLCTKSEKSSDMNLSHKEDLTIKCYETDILTNLTPFAFMNMAQEAANLHATEINFGYDDLIKNRLAWVLSRLRIKFLNTPKWRDKTTLETWHKGNDGLFALRDFLMSDASGSPAIVAASYWLIINIDTRRIQRTDHVPGYAESKADNPRDVMEEKCEKIVAPDHIELHHEHIVQYSDLDMNGHTNNAKYIEWAIDSIDPAFLLNKTFKEIEISFNLESKLDDKIDLYIADITENIKYIEGKREDKSIFQTKMYF